MADKQSDPKPLKMVLFGKTGAGKSASGNTILGKEYFESRPSSSSVTTKCSTGKKKQNNQTQELIVVDTPGLFNTKCEQKVMMKELVHFLLSVVAEQMPDAFLFVIERGSFDREVAKSIRIFKEVFDKATEHTIVLFTHGNEKEVKAFIKAKNNEDLDKFVKECKGGYHVFDNNIKDEEQVLKLVEKINSMVKKNGKPYSSSGLERAKNAIEALENQPEVKTAGNPEDRVMKKNRMIEKLIDVGINVLQADNPFVEFLGWVHEKIFNCC